MLVELKVVSKVDLSVEKMVGEMGAKLVEYLVAPMVVDLAESLVDK